MSFRRFHGGGMKGRVSKKVDVDGVILDSKKEAERYKQLLPLVQAKVIEHLVVHPKYRIEVNGVHICDYEADFQYCVVQDKESELCDRAIMITEDVKDFRIGKDGKIKFSSRTRDYMLRKKLMLAVHGIAIVEWPERPKISRRKK